MNAKPRYPAHVFHHLVRYPRLTCEECGGPILPRLHQPNKGNKREHLESITRFKHRQFCSKSCSNRAHARGRKTATPKTTPKTTTRREPATAMNGKPKTTAARQPSASLDPATRRLLHDALNKHDGPDSPLADMFQGGAR